MRPAHFEIRLPGWAEQHLRQHRGAVPDENARMQLAIEFAERNVAAATGGPFGALVVDLESSAVVAAGVNLVTGTNCSIAHAEIVALSLAQKAVGSYDLGSAAGAGYELVTSTEPCAMCLGAIPWSGVRRVVCGAREADAVSIGMDEGDKPPDWQSGLERRGITVVRDVCRTRAASVLRAYRDRGGVIYNGGRGAKTA